MVVMMVNRYNSGSHFGFNWVVETIKRNQDTKGFEVVPKRWVVERTFGWFGRYRRFSAKVVDV